MTDMILERMFEPGLTPADVLEMAEESGGCFSLYRVDWNQSFLNPDGQRLLCWLAAPDAESVRMALRQRGIDYHALWPASVHDSAAASAPPWQQANVLVERCWEEPVAIEDIQALEDTGQHCLDLRRVRFSRTFFSADRRRMVCLYQAPDAESVRTAQQQARMPFSDVWACTPVRDL